MAVAITTGEDIISPAMQGIVGKVLTSRTSYPISASDIRKWALAVYYPATPPQRFRGIGTAGGEPALRAPEDFNPFAWGCPGETPKAADISPAYIENMAGISAPPLQFIVNGGSVVEYGAPMIEGDVITAEFSVGDYTVKQGKRGPMLLTRALDRWTNQRGEVVRTSTMTLIRY